MAFEKSWLQVGPQLFTVDGNPNGTITLATTSGFKVKQNVKISAIGEPTLTLEVKRVLSPTTLLVGPKDKGLNERTDISSYTVAKVSTISAEAQNKVIPPINDRESAIYEQEPTVAKRVIQVDEWGRFYSISNPLPVNATVDVELSHTTDSVKVGDGTEFLSINTDGSINVKIGELPGTPIMYQELDTISDDTETQVAEYISNNDLNKIKRFYGQAMTYGVWRLYKNSIDSANLLAITQTSPMSRNADLIFIASKPILDTESVIVTFQAERYRIGSSSETFVLLEGYVL